VTVGAGIGVVLSGVAEVSLGAPGVGAFGFVEAGVAVVSEDGAEVDAGAGAPVD